jgi:hypothetical protein
MRESRSDVWRSIGWGELRFCRSARPNVFTLFLNFLPNFMPVWSDRNYKIIITPVICFQILLRIKTSVMKIPFGYRKICTKVAWDWTIKMACFELWFACRRMKFYLPEGCLSILFLFFFNYEEERGIRHYSIYLMSIGWTVHRNLSCKWDSDLLDKNRFESRYHCWTAEVNRLIPPKMYAVCIDMYL